MSAEYGCSVLRLLYPAAVRCLTDRNPCCYRDLAVCQRGPAVRSGCRLNPMTTLGRVVAPILEPEVPAGGSFRLDCSRKLLRSDATFGTTAEAMSSIRPCQDLDRRVPKQC